MTEYFLLLLLCFEFQVPGSAGDFVTELCSLCACVCALSSPPKLLDSGSRPRVPPLLWLIMAPESSQVACLVVFFISLSHVLQESSCLPNIMRIGSSHFAVTHRR